MRKLDTTSGRGLADTGTTKNTHFDRSACLVGALPNPEWRTGSTFNLEFAPSSQILGGGVTNTHGSNSASFWDPTTGT